MKQAQKWDFKLKKYEPIEIDELCTCYTDDLSALVRCPHCKRLFEYGTCYTSRQIHTFIGMGYAVCEACYKKEWDEYWQAQEAQEE